MYHECLQRVSSFHVIVPKSSLDVGCFFKFTSEADPKYLSYHVLTALTVNIMFVLMMLPILISSLFRHTWKIVMMSWTATMVALVISIFVSKAYKSMWTLLLYVPSSLILLYQNKNKRHEISKLVLSKTPEIVAVTREAESSVKESQNMVSNVTHDLKTVSRNY